MTNRKDGGDDVFWRRKRPGENIRRVLTVVRRERLHSVSVVTVTRQVCKRRKLTVIIRLDGYINQLLIYTLHKSILRIGRPFTDIPKQTIKETIIL